MYFILLFSVVVITFGYNYLFNNDFLLDFLGGKDRALSICHFVFVLQFLTQYKLNHDCFGHNVRFPSRSSLPNCESEWGNQFVFEARRYDLRGSSFWRVR